MPANQYPHGFTGGLSVRGVPILQTMPGEVFWVDSTSGSNGNKGNQGRSWASVDYAIGRCAANRGDIILVAPGHVETVTAAAGLALDIAGVTIIGLGTGSKRAQVNFTTAVGASMVASAANCTMSNILFTGGFDALTNPIHIQAADFSLLNFETRDVTGQATDFIVTTAAADRLMIDGWKHAGAAAAGADTAISIVGGADATVKNFWIDGNFAVAAIENVTTAATNLSIYGDRPCYLRTRNAADVLITLVATSTGNIGPNLYGRLLDDAANITEALVGADMQFFPPLLIANADNEQGFAWNGATSADA